MNIRRYLRFLFDLSHGLRLRLSWLVFAGMARVGVMLVFVLVCKRLVDIATRSVAGPFWPAVTLLAGCILAQIALTAIASRLGLSVSVRCANSLRSRIFAGGLSMPYSRSAHSACVTERMKKDTDIVADLVSSAIPTSFVTLFQLCAAFALLAVLDWRLALIMVSIMPLALLIGKSFLRRMRRLTRHIRSLDTHIHTHAQEHLRHRLVDAAFCAVPQTVGRFDRLQLRLYRLMMRRNNYSLFSRSMVQLGFSAGYATAFLWGVNGLWTGAVTFGVMTAFLQLVAQVQRPAFELARQIPAFVYGITSAERIDEIVGIEGHGAQSGQIGTDDPVGVCLSGLSFRYPDGETPVLRALTHDFAPGSLTAVTGATGVGKTTLLRLLLAVVRPTEGSVSFYTPQGIVEDASEGTRSLISFVPQGNTLLSGTIRSNLCLGDSEASDSQMHYALEAACAEFVFDLPAGLDTRVGEGGAALSEGQAQRIAVARGLLRKSPVILFDEPTSALDSETEHRLMANIAALAPKRTVIVITHRSAPAAACPERLAITAG